MISRSTIALTIFAGVLLAQTPPAAPKAKPATPSKPKAAAPKSVKPGATKTTTASAVPSGKVVLTIGDEKVTENEFSTFVEALPDQYKAQAQGPMKRQVAEQFVRVRLLANEARKRGLDQDKVILAKIAFQTENLLAGGLFNELQAKANVDEAALRKSYDEHKGEFEQAQARHILIKFKGSPVPLKEGKKELTEEEALAKAQEIKKRIDGGEDFAKLAKEESDDAGSGAQGGELGTFKRGAMVPQFDQAAFSQPIGQVGEPMKTQFGYHIIKVEKRESKSFEEVRSDLEKRLRPEVARKSVEDIRQGTSVTFDDAYFGPETPAPGPPAPAK